MGEVRFVAASRMTIRRRADAASRALGLALLVVTVPCWGQTAKVPDSQRQTALALEQQWKSAEAEAAWRLCLKGDPANAEPYAHIGLLEARQEHYKEAIPFYRKALTLDPAFSGLHLNLGLALFKGGELKPAIHEFNLLLKAASPGSPEAQRLTILVAMAHYGLNEYAEAVPYLKQAAASDTQNLQLRLALAHSCLWSKQYQCVLDTYHEILTLNAESAEADMLAGEAQDELKDHAGAIEQFRAAEKADPKEPDVHFGLGYLLWGQRRYPEAASEFQAELSNNPNHVQAMIYLADAEMQTGHPEIAEPLLEKAIRIDAERELAHLDLGILYADAGRKEDALRELKEAAKVAPEDVTVHWRLGRLLKTMGKPEEAKAELAKASSITKAADDKLIDKMNGASKQPAQEQQPVPPAGK
ncbi:MAG: tetratricopeptide repeat protein [Terracidiphilus sp.]